MTAGILPARRVRRAPPLPNSVRGSAGRRTSDTVVLLYSLIWTVAVSLRRGTWPRRQRTNTASITDTACSCRRSLAGQPRQSTGVTSLRRNRLHRAPRGHLDLDAHAGIGQPALQHGGRRADVTEIALQYRPAWFELGAIRQQVVHPHDVVERGAGLGQRGADVAQALLGLGDDA